MGFSLSRALAGAVMGAAHEVGEIADAHLKEAARTRELDDQYRRQLELAKQHDEMVAQRQARVEEMKTARENDRRKEVKSFMAQGLSVLKSEGLDSGSVAGQRRLSELAGSNGYLDYQDKFADNAIKLSQIESNADLKRAEMATRAETARLAREARAGDREGRIDANTKQAVKELNNTIDGFVVERYDRDNHKVTDTSAADAVRAEADKLRNAGKSPSEINSALLNFKPLFNEQSVKNPGASGADLFSGAKSELQNRMAPKAQTTGPAPVTVQPSQTVPKAKPRIPSMFESKPGGILNSGPNDPMVGAY